MIARRKAAVAAVVFTILVLASVNIGWWWYYRSMTTYLEEQLSRRLTGAAATAALHLTPETVNNLLLDNLDTYAETILYLDSIAAIGLLSEATILDLDFNYLASTRTDVPTEGYLLARRNLDFLQIALNGQTTASALYNIDGTYLKSAYTPLYDSDGLVAGILAVEAGAGYFDLLATLRRNLYILAGGSAGVVVLLLVFFIFYNRRMAAAEEQLFKAGSQAALGRMVAVVSHEVKNPLMILRAAGERLEKKYTDPEASFITEEVSRLDRIVSGYLSFARGDAQVDKTNIDIVALTNKIIERMRPQFEEQQVELETIFPDIAQDIPADPVGIRQVMLNLLLNALHAAAEQDGIEKKVSIGIENSTSKCTLRVSDSGAGIKPSQRDKLFEPFFTTKTQGSGLGLYLCRKIVEQHGGTISVGDNESGQTTFTVVLPKGGASR
ncbi:MAG: HAMP domain-containing sensor histidine kinase [Candidatus Zixiibacteriota bacterium]